MNIPKFNWIRKVLVIGSGAVKIGEAAEFDYSGSQCLKALREEGIETILINPNIATIQTDPRLAGKIYLLPITPEYVQKVIEREKPDGILLGFGGQTALNCGVQLKEKGILEKFNIKVLGTPVKTIEDTEDRALFKQAMIRADIPVPKSKAATSLKEAINAAKEIKYPVIIRVAYILGGKGSGVANNEKELTEIVQRALAQSMISQVLIEEYLGHWKEIEYPVIIRVAYILGGKGSGVAHNEKELKEIVKRALAQSIISQVLIEEYVGHWKEIEFEVIRDNANNCIAVCSMENIDPMGIHTGDSIVVAPAQTLNNREYHLIRSASIKVIQNLGVIGECNIQWALDKKSEEHRAIEVNSRMSRSSALASKATGYPLAYIATKLAIGYLLPELINIVTGVTTACFEPALDYVVVKFPRWDLQKFRSVDRHIGPQMKSVGEVMAIGRCLEETLQKAIRMLDIGKVGLVCNPEDEEYEPTKIIKDILSNPTDQRLFTIVKALKKNISIEEIYQLSGVDPFFLHKIENIISIAKKLRSVNLDDKNFLELLKEAKRLGFSDEQIAICLKTDKMTIRKLRKRANVIPVVKQIDTLAAEWPAKTNYLYLTYGGDEDDIDFRSDISKVIVLGAGVFRIGSSVEFDWCGVNTIWALKKSNIQEAIMINYNPETVSTDYDMSDKLYFEELTLERILDIYEKENPLGVIVSVGGQIPNNLALKLVNAGIKILGTSGKSIDLAEDRSKFSALLDQLAIPQPEWSKLTATKDAKIFAEKIGYPILIRPSYVLSGSAMRVAYTKYELDYYLKLATKVSREHPVVISKFMQMAKEVEVDGISDGEDTIIGAIIEHIENAGIHSGDATMSIPTQTLTTPTLKIIEDYTYKIAKALQIIGPFNIQYLVKNCIVYVIECNLRASRSMPYVSKTRGVNLIELATLTMLGKKLRELNIPEFPQIPYVGVKVPQFSFMRLSGADPILGVEMLSTGEVACLGENFADAFSKALQSAAFKIPPKNGSVLITVGGEELKRKVVPLAISLSELGFKIYATEHTSEALQNAGLQNISILYKVRDTDMNPNILEYLQKGKIDLVINIPLIKNSGNSNTYAHVLEDEYIIRRLAVEFNVPVITTLELASALIKMLKYSGDDELTLRTLNEYMDSLPWKYW